MSDSDVEIKKIRPMKPVKKPPGSPTENFLLKERKVTTKAMIHEALTELKTRKGVSIQAIKKFMEAKYCVDTDRVKYLIKKTLKKGVEDGSIIQLKGIGASGSFKLAAVKEKPKKKPKSKNEEPKKEKSIKAKSKEKPMNEKKEKIEKLDKKERKEKKEEMIDEIRALKKIKIDVKDKEKKIEKPKEKKKADSKVKVKAKTAAGAEGAAPSKKKATMVKRKSIGSIIKPPKMKPKSRA